MTEKEHVIKISHALYMRMAALAKEHKFSGVGAALEDHLRRLEEKL